MNTVSIQVRVLRDGEEFGKIEFRDFDEAELKTCETGDFDPQLALRALNERAKTIYSPVPTEAIMSCTRDYKHPGPCNGFPRPICAKMAAVAQQVKPL
jgi:hypothetical protein